MNTQNALRLIINIASRLKKAVSTLLRHHGMPRVEDEAKK